MTKVATSVQPSLPPATFDMADLPAVPLAVSGSNCFVDDASRAMKVLPRDTSPHVKSTFLVAEAL